MTERSLAGKRVVVVGGSAGIGRAFALKALEDRARLVVVARRELPAEVLADAAQVTSVSADIRNPDDCRRIGETAASTLGQVDLLLISAGYAPLKAFSDVDAEDWMMDDELKLSFTGDAPTLLIEDDSEQVKVVSGALVLKSTARNIDLVVEANQCIIEDYPVCEPTPVLDGMEPTGEDFDSCSAERDDHPFAYLSAGACQ
mgnify:CR=1 FL=1